MKTLTMIIIGTVIAIGGIAIVNPAVRADLAANPTIAAGIQRAKVALAPTAGAAAAETPESAAITPPVTAAPAAAKPAEVKVDTDRGYTPNVVLSGIELINCKPKNTIAIKEQDEYVKKTPRDQIDWAGVRAKVCA